MLFYINIKQNIQAEGSTFEPLAVGGEVGKGGSGVTDDFTADLSPDDVAPQQTGEVSKTEPAHEKQASAAEKDQEEQVAFHHTAIEFRKLITVISEHFTNEELLRIAFIYNIPSSTPLGTMEYLTEMRMFSEFNMEPLVKLLKDINRYDLIEKVKAFQEQSAGMWPIV